MFQTFVHKRPRCSKVSEAAKKKKVSPYRSGGIRVLVQCGFVTIMFPFYTTHTRPFHPLYISKY